MSDRVELYGTAGCPYTAELREQLEWDGAEFVEYDVERDAAARHRLLGLIAAPARVPVLVADGVVTAIGFQGRTCVVDLGGSPSPPSPPSPPAREP
jgi:mycoredoxin